MNENDHVRFVGLLGASISKVHGQMPVDRYNQAFSDAHSTKYSDKFKEGELGSR